jgi:3-methylcrotonyl-CoA carboxylase alpha subunit
VEFIAEGDAFYFMEMNTRLQVEHPVTEMITGQDLVEWQLRVADGEKLPATAEQLAIGGHAIEVRVYAEDPARDFLPSIGTLVHLRQPAETQCVRVDSGVRQGDAITPNYDPMIAKLIVHGATRAAAVRRLAAALREYEVVGVQTNLALLRAIAAHPAFAAGELDTGFISRHGEALFATPAIDAEPALVAAALTLLAEQQHAIQANAPTNDPYSPWGLADSWRMNSDGYQDFSLRHADTEIALRAAPRLGGYDIELNGRTIHAAWHDEERGTRLALNGVLHQVRVVRNGSALVVILHGANHIITPIDRLAPPRVEVAGDDRLSSPVPARVARILVQPGDAVKKGAPLMVLEAMKMELTLSAPLAGIIATIRHKVDDMVQEGADLITFEPGAP